jgi:prefoldin subunit 5
MTQPVALTQHKQELKQSLEGVLQAVNLVPTLLNQPHQKQFASLSQELQRREAVILAPEVALPDVNQHLNVYLRSFSRVATSAARLSAASASVQACLDALQPTSGPMTPGRQSRAGS